MKGCFKRLREKAMKTEIQKAVTILRDGGVVAIPTETVYGLAAKISDELALRSIFKTKNRPFFDPLIVHVTSIDEAKRLTSAWTAAVQILAETFWPGPLTLVLPKTKLVSDLITSGLDTVAIRIPKHPVAIEIIQQLGEPVAAPSANKFGKTSPSEANHVRQEFGESIFVVDGGACEVGIESTIIKVEESDIAIDIKFLRYGFIGEKEIREALKVQKKSIQFSKAESKIEAPGQIKHHYMPAIPLIMIESSFWKKSGESLQAINQKLNTHFLNPSFLQLSERPEQAARELYGRLRTCSVQPHDVILFIKEDFQNDGFWNAILDRLQRASTFFV